MISRETIRRGFPIKPLGEVAEFLDSRRRPITASERIPGPYPYYGANGQQDSVGDYIFDEPLILLAEDGGSFDQPDRGIAYAIEGKTWVNNHAHVLRPRDHARLRYLVRVLENYDVTPWITGSTRAKLTKAGAFKIQIPLPALAEQKRIAGILDAADAVRAKRREALAQIDTLLQSTFLDMFGDPVTNPMGWPPTSLAAISEELRDGPFGSNLKTSHYVESGVRVIRLQNIGVGEIRNDDLAFISEEHFASLPRNHCQPGDVIIGTMGDPNLRACIVPLALARALNKADCILMRVDMTKVDAIYVCWLLNNPCTVSMALRLVRGQTRGRISLRRLKELQIHLPPIDLQLRFAAIVKSVEQQKAIQRAHLAELDTLFASLQSRAFRGDL